MSFVLLLGGLTSKRGLDNRNIHRRPILAFQLLLRKRGSFCNVDVRGEATARGGAGGDVGFPTLTMRSSIVATMVIELVRKLYPLEMDAYMLCILEKRIWYLLVSLLP